MTPTNKATPGKPPPSPPPPPSAARNNVSAVAGTARGAFIVLEGVDRCGKTTQAGLLVKHLLQLGLAAVAMRFPDRTTPVGNLINSYLQSKADLDDRAVHLLFSANRWEAVPTLKRHLIDEKANVVCDRYAHSGVAFSSSKPALMDDLDWCRACDVGLPAPDAVIFLDLKQEEAELRGGFGEERYEEREMQVRVRQRFSQLEAMDRGRGGDDGGNGDDVEHDAVPWYIVNAARSIADVQKDINAIVERTIDRIQRDDAPLGLLWKAAAKSRDGQQE